jgi:hypothetical protein
MIERKTICVERVVNGVWEWLPLENQTAYGEWVGCFSIV